MKNIPTERCHVTVRLEDNTSVFCGTFLYRDAGKDIFAYCTRCQKLVDDAKALRDSYTGRVVRTATYFQIGYAAFGQGIHKESCPFNPGTSPYDCWIDGWTSAEYDAGN